MKRAQLEAKSYTPYRGAHRDLIVQLLLDAAEERWRTDPPGRRYFFANWGRRAVWAEPEALGELDPCRVRTRWPMLVEGAQFLARFGAFSCIACGMAFRESGRYERGVGRRFSRRYHCDACKDRFGTLAASQIGAIRKALDAATGQRRAWRAARRTA